MAGVGRVVWNNPVPGHLTRLATYWKSNVSREWPHVADLVAALKEAGWTVRSFGTPAEYVDGADNMTGIPMRSVIARAGRCVCSSNMPRVPGCPLIRSCSVAMWCSTPIARGVR